MNYNNQYRPNSFGGLPVVTKNIIIINVIMYLFTIVLKQTNDIDLTKYLGLHYYTAPDFKPHQFVTYIFMHDTHGFSHIFFNMFGVYIFGQVLENIWGGKRYLMFYLLTGLGAALAQYIIIYFSVSPLVNSIENLQNNLNINSFEALFKSPVIQNNLNFEFTSEFKSFVSNYNQAISSDNNSKALSLASQFLLDFKNSYLNSQVVIGASGSLFGLLGAFGLLFPNTLLYVYFFIPVKAKWLVIGYGAFELFSGLSNNPGDNVAHFAHLGGLAVGIVLVIIWRRNKRHFY